MILRGLRSLVITEILLGLQQRSRGGSQTRPAPLARVFFGRAPDKPPCRLCYDCYG